LKKGEKNGGRVQRKTNVFFFFFFLIGEHGRVPDQLSLIIAGTGSTQYQRLTSSIQ